MYQNLTLTRDFRVNDIANEQKRAEEGDEEALDYGDQNRELQKLECKRTSRGQWFEI